MVEKFSGIRMDLAWSDDGYDFHCERKDLSRANDWYIHHDLARTKDSYEELLFGHALSESED